MDVSRKNPWGDARGLFGRAALVAVAVAAGVILDSLVGVIVAFAAAAAVECGVVVLARRERRAAQLAVAEERRRLARELHDGLAQDLAFVSTCGRRLSQRAGGDHLLEAVSAAAASALEEVRGAIAGLDRSADEALADAVRRSSSEVADRFGVDVTVTGDAAGLEAAPRHDVIQLVREAINNAALHGGARKVEVELGGSALLRVRDDGCGLPPSGPVRAGSRGLRGMEERADRLGGSLHAQNHAAGGAEFIVS